MNPVPVLAFVNTKAGVGKTSLVFHLAWMLSRVGHRVLTCDLNPQANLTSSFLDEASLEELWHPETPAADSCKTVFQSIRPLMDALDVRPLAPKRIAADLFLIPGDLSLAGFEDTLSDQWPKEQSSVELCQSLRVQTGFHRLVQQGAARVEASAILMDVGANLGAINRSALIASDHVIVPLGADLASFRSLGSLGSTLNRWREDWKRRKAHWHDNRLNPTQANGLTLPGGNMHPLGYVVQKPGYHLGRPIQPRDRWFNRIPAEFGRKLAGQRTDIQSATPADDEHCLAVMKHYRSLVPMAQEMHKPMFDLTPADGAVGSHAVAARDAERSFRELAMRISTAANLVPVNTWP
ncbi:MAG: ParA family protein [Caldilineaceae bacterium SB0662_bin_9]|uniref:ParA family protein n=1 Tax=Caldilineaceae bacterium SB0662_bin_9 TaxID=2605258 RepID=A0A6B1DRT6_9CHLR|nr:ParA family protein [Caldilineaceae bacterium SB0662_bin_9]